MSLSIQFVKSGRGKAQCPSNPEYPEGVHLNADAPDPACVATLPYPAPECGYWDIECDQCGITVAVTAAGRRDDPRTVRIPCERKPS